MFFCKDKSLDGGFWVDRGIDGKADHLEPCEVCKTGLEVAGLEEKVWNAFEPCYECNMKLEIQGAIRGVVQQRPYILDREPEIINIERDPVDTRKGSDQYSYRGLGGTDEARGSEPFTGFMWILP